MKASNKNELLKIFERDKGVLTSPGFSYKKSESYIYIETRFGYYHDKWFRHVRYYFTNTECFSIKYSVSKEKWIVEGNKFSSVINIGIANDDFKQNVNEIIDFWNDNFPLWPIKKHEKRITYQFRLYLKMFSRFYQNPALTLVYNDLGSSSVTALGQYAYIDSRVNSYPYKYLDCFNYSASNTKDFLGCNTKTFQWIKKLNLSLPRISILSRTHSWEISRRLHELNFTWEICTKIIKNILYAGHTANHNEKILSYLTRLKKCENYSDEVIYDMTKIYIDCLHMVEREDLNIKISAKINLLELKKLHDSIVLIYNAKVLHRESLENIKSIKIANSIRNYIKPMLVDGYYFSLPENELDLLYEGIALNHCVHSYKEKYETGKCHIVFQRKDKDKSLLTVEIDQSFNTIIQHRGNLNRNPTLNETKALSKYIAEVKNIVKSKNGNRIL